MKPTYQPVAGSTDQKKITNRNGSIGNVVKAKAEAEAEESDQWSVFSDQSQCSVPPAPCSMLHALIIVLQSIKN